MNDKQKDLANWKWEDHTLRRETGLVEHTCPHGVGHPNPGSAQWLNEETGSGDEYGFGVHGCDGCCGYEGYPTLDDSIVYAMDQLIPAFNEIVKNSGETPPSYNYLKIDIDAHLSSGPKDGEAARRLLGRVHNHIRFLRGMFSEEDIFDIGRGVL